jgi:hypothetical protein
MMPCHWLAIFASMSFAFRQLTPIAISVDAEAPAFEFSATPAPPLLAFAFAIDFIFRRHAIIDRCRQRAMLAFFTPRLALFTIYFRQIFFDISLMPRIIFHCR